MRRIEHESFFAKPDDSAIGGVVEYLGVADRKAAYFVMRKCRFALEAREQFSEWLESLR
ncbi:hypothetical protein ATHL_00029 [Anaerolinea thermolimosa]|uniref:hypothetical protein n=1 Tax=Anaerolinea thermolimosa TaxID=229919 RepID=UPI0013B374DD|nr:hypothetical protein [Anaerolinea thermolimosa]GAP05200.1 hypothetical protein ATHL_00029 [Anaerolinea thermolimosa]